MSFRLHAVPSGAADPDLPPGQQLATGFPVVSSRTTPELTTGEWTLTLTSETGDQRRWDWAAIHRLGVRAICVDLHAAQGWSVLATNWAAVPVSEMFNGLRTAAEYALLVGHDGYTTSLPVDDLLEMPTWIAVGLETGPIPPEHGGPARLLVPHLYLHQSTKWVRGILLSRDDEPGTSDSAGRHHYGDPWREQRTADPATCHPGAPSPSATDHH